MYHQKDFSNSNKSFFLSKGFREVGRWEKVANGLDYSIDKKRAKLPAVYVFIDNNDQVLYVGRTVLGLEDALNRIKRGYEAQETNHRIHNHLVDHLQKGNSVEILTYTNLKDHTDLNAFLDELKTELLQHISPLWNLK